MQRANPIQIIIQSTFGSVKQQDKTTAEWFYGNKLKKKLFNLESTGFGFY